MRNMIGEVLLHFGWALFGQECDCGHNLFNGVARFAQRVLPQDSDTVFKIGSLVCGCRYAPDRLKKKATARVCMDAHP